MILIHDACAFYSCRALLNLFFWQKYGKLMKKNVSIFLLYIYCMISFLFLQDDNNSATINKKVCAYVGTTCVTTGRSVGRGFLQQTNQQSWTNSPVWRSSGVSSPFSRWCSASKGSRPSDKKGKKEKRKEKKMVDKKKATRVPAGPPLHHVIVLIVLIGGSSSL